MASVGCWKGNGSDDGSGRLSGSSQWRLPMSKAEKREELARRVRENLIPTLEQLGFESTRKSMSERSDDPVRGHFFKRRRDRYEDEVWIHWDKYGRPRFILEFKTTQMERMT